MNLSMAESSIRPSAVTSDVHATHQDLSGQRCDSRRDWLIRRWRQTRTVGAELVAFGPLDTLGDEDDEAPATEGAHARLAHWELGGKSSERQSTRPLASSSVRASPT